MTGLEALENSNPSEAMECLENLCDEFPILKKDYKIINQALLKAQEMEKALKIIKEKNVDVYTLVNQYDTVEEYNQDLRTNPTYYCYSNCEELTKEEFNTLKRWVKR